MIGLALQIEPNRTDSKKRFNDANSTHLKSMSKEGEMIALAINKRLLRHYQPESSRAGRSALTS